ncbi:LysM peptidoglycan-binding domain-containing protein [Acidaminococcus intestini]|uniref:LysM peptidoglycan-binding domain-containing protein n=1 Tax=Acidaminococcus intestini TaxID=187327 RepID=UPI003AB4F479
MNMKAKAALIAAALISAGILTAGAIWEERTKPDPPSEYLTFEHVVHTGDSLWSLTERYAGYEDIQDIIQRALEDNGITDPGALQPGMQIKVRVKKGGR